MVTVPRIAEGRTVVCIGTGPSLTQSDVDLCRDQIVVAVNDAYRWAPFAKVIHASDGMWWKVHKGVPSFTGLKYCLEPVIAKFPDVQVLRNTGAEGIELDPTAVRHGRNSGFAALNVAVHMGASRILLLGYDMRHGERRKTHFFGDHPAPLRNSSPFPLFLQAFMSAVKPLQALNVEVLNCTRVSSLTIFPKADLSDALGLKETVGAV